MALPLIVMAVIFIFSLAMIPSINPAPHHLRIAIVNEDQGLTASTVNMGDTVVSNIQSATSANSDGEPAMKWIEVGSEEEVKAGLDNQEYYAALVIPEDFSGEASIADDAGTIFIPGADLYQPRHECIGI